MGMCSQRIFWLHTLRGSHVARLGAATFVLVSVESYLYAAPSLLSPHFGIIIYVASKSTSSFATGCKARQEVRGGKTEKGTCRGEAESQACQMRGAESKGEEGTAEKKPHVKCRT